MREILFKAKRIDNGEWVEGYVFDDGFADSERLFVGGLVITDYKGTADDRWDVGLNFYEVNPDTLCQYTGLTDKNGNKIWENDVIKNSNIHALGKVEFMEDTFCLNDVYDGKQYINGMWNDFEIIGNIFDNPELLGGVVIKFDGENWTQRKSKHTGVVLEDENEEVASDLISRSALIDYIKMWDVGCGIGHEQKTFIEAIARQPIVFDVDAVIKELREYRDFITIQGRGFVDGAISIVKKGGV